MLGLEVTPRIPFSKSFFKVVRAGFSSPRKKLINNLGRFFKTDREKLEKILIDLQIDPKARALNLSIENWTDLAKILVDKRTLGI